MTRGRVVAVLVVLFTALGLIAPHAQDYYRSFQTTPIGTGGAQAFVTGTLFTSTTATSTTGLVEETLLSYTLPANTLAVNGRGVRITAGATFAANTNAKSFKVYFGGSTLVDSANFIAAPNNVRAYETWTLFRTAPTLQYAMGLFTFSATATSGQSVPGETLASPILIKLTGTGATTIGDITATLLLVEAI